MNRALLLLPLAALATGCYSAPPCDPVANVYWGFAVPGLTGPALTCSEAGVDTVRVFVDGSFLEDVACTTQGVDGIQLVGYGHGTHRLQLEAYTGGTTGTLRYSSDGSLAMNSCTTNADVVPQGIAGNLDLGYLFSPANNCVSGTYAWFQLRDASNTVYDLAPNSTLYPCGTQPIRVANLAPGIYTLSRFEVGTPTTGSPIPDYHACAGQVFVHAGDESLTTTLSLAATNEASCWP